VTSQLTSNIKLPFRVKNLYSDSAVGLYPVSANCHRLQ